VTFKKFFGGILIEEYVYGVYDSLERANEIMTIIFDKNRDEMGIEELGIHDYFTDGDSFQLNKEEIDTECVCNITEVTLNEDNTSIF